MQFSEVLALPDAVIGNVKVKNKEGLFETAISVRGWLTPGLAEIVGLRSTVFSDNDTPRPGFTYIEDNTAGCGSFKALFEVAGLKQACEMSGDKVEGVAVERADGQLWLHLRLKCSSDPLIFFGFWKQVGSASGTCKITPLQQELDIPVEEETAEESTIVDRSHENRPRGGRRGRKSAVTAAGRESVVDTGIEELTRLAEEAEESVIQ